jgi:hypothetical protein
MGSWLSGKTAADKADPPEPPRDLWVNDVILRYIDASGLFCVWCGDPWSRSVGQGNQEWSTKQDGPPVLSVLCHCRTCDGYWYEEYRLEGVTLQKPGEFVDKEGVD